MPVQGEKIMNSLKVGTFVIRGSMSKGYWIEDRCTFNNWGVKRAEDGQNFKTRSDACDYASRCHDFKVGRRSTV